MSSRQFSLILSLVRFWKISVTEWYLNWKIVFFFFFKKHLISLPCHLPAPRDNFSPQRANRINVPKIAGLCMEFAGKLPAASCCSVTSSRRLRTPHRQRSLKLPCPLDFTGQGIWEHLQPQLSPHLPRISEQDVTTAHCTFSSCSSMNKGSGSSSNSLDI